MTEWRRYVATRFASSRMLTLLLLLLAAAWSASFPSGPIDAVADAVIAILLLLEFRLWDDLRDVELDRVRHPECVLSRSGNLAPFQWLLVTIAMLAVAIVVWCRPGASVAALGLLHIALWTWYRMPRRTQWATANYHIVLLKYPVFVFVLAARFEMSWDFVLPTAMVCVYLSLCVYEVCHDNRLRSKRGSRVVAGLETVTLLTVLVLGAGAQIRVSDSDDNSTSAPSSAALSPERN